MTTPNHGFKRVHFLISLCKKLCHYWEQRRRKIMRFSEAEPMWKLYDEEESIFLSSFLFLGHELSFLCVDLWRRETTENPVRLIYQKPVQFCFFSFAGKGNYWFGHLTTNQRFGSVYISSKNGFKSNHTDII